MRMTHSTINLVEKIIRFLPSGRGGTADALG